MSDEAARLTYAVGEGDRGEALVYRQVASGQYGLLAAEPLPWLWLACCQGQPCQPPVPILHHRRYLAAFFLCLNWLQPSTGRHARS